ncbi:MAG TPA: hypothetical protein VLV15_16530 [Dongiaceae bacterium]|nr:hypothetical protein [Dongiaceae bacterium]
MKLDARSWVAPIVALVVLALVLNLTLVALRTSGVWNRAKVAFRPVKVTPYARLDQVLANRPVPGATASLRDPFSFGPAPQVANVTPRVHHPVAPPPPPQPVLTSIVWDADPRATIRWSGRDYSVRANSLFADFRVVSITAQQVVLERGGENLVLRLPVKGESP